MKREDFIKRYKENLNMYFRVEKHVLNRRELKRYISNLLPFQTVVVGVDSFDGEGSGHAMFLVKTRSGYHFYDPNQGAYHAGFAAKKSLDEVLEEILPIYGTDLGRFDAGLKGYKQYSFESLFMPAKAWSSEGGDELVAPVAQTHIMNIVAAYYNTEYNKQGQPMEAAGVCYGLSLMLREFVMQTGSLTKGSNKLYDAMHQLEKSTRTLKILDTGKLSIAEVQKLKGNSLILAMIPFFQSLQSASVQNAGIKDEWEAGAMMPKKKNGIRDHGFTLPFSMLMYEKEGLAQAKVSLTCTNPAHTFSELSKLAEAELDSIYSSALKDKRFIDSQEKALELIQKNVIIMRFISSDLLSDRDFMQQAIMRNEKAFRYLPQELLKDKAYMSNLIPYSKKAVDMVDPEFLKDKAFLLRAITYYPTVLNQIDRAMLDVVDLSALVEVFRDRGKMLEAIKRDHKAFGHINKALKEDPDFLLDAIGVNVNVLDEVFEKYRNDPGFLLDAIERNSVVWQMMDAGIKSDRHFVIEAVKRNKDILPYLGEDLLSDKGFILSIVGIAPEVMRHVVGDLYASEFILEAIEQNVACVQFIDHAFLSDRALMVKAVLINEKVLDYIPSLKNDAVFNVRLKGARLMSKAKYRWFGGEHPKIDQGSAPAPDVITDDFIDLQAYDFSDMPKEGVEKDLEVHQDQMQKNNKGL